MADHYDKNTRNAASEIAEDDPLAELARIIGYDRPAEPQSAAVQTGGAGEGDDTIDLEAELLRELEAGQPELRSSSDNFAPETVPDVEGIAEISDADNFDVGDDWLTERPVDLEQFEAVGPSQEAGPSEVAERFEVGEAPTFEAAPRYVRNYGSKNLHLPDVPDLPIDPDYSAEQSLAEEENLPDLPDEELFEALEQELSITADELVLDEGKNREQKVQPDWDGATWDSIVGEVAGDEDGVAAANEIIAEANQFGMAEQSRDDDLLARDDDILADMARFDIPTHGDLAKVSAALEPVVRYSRRPQVVDGDELIDEPDLTIFEFDETEEAASEVKIETPVDQSWGKVNSLEEVRTFEDEQSFEDELAAGLDDFSALLDGDDRAKNTNPPEIPTVQDAPVDPFDELEADFDDAAASFLDDEEFELDLVEEAAPTETSVEPTPLSADADEPFEGDEPESIAGGGEVDVALGGDDEISSAFSDLLPEDTPENRSVTEPSETVDEDLVWPEYPPDDHDTNSKGLFGAAAALAAGVGLVTVTKPRRAEGRGEWNGDVDPISEPAFDESEWLDALGIEENDTDDGDNSASAQGVELMQSTGQDDSVLAFPVSRAGYVDTQAYGGASHRLVEQTNDMGSDVFDESAISETDDQPYFVGEIDVPDLPLDEPRADAGINDYFEDDLDREFASLVDADGETGLNADGSQGSSNNWQQNVSAISADANADYANLESDLGLTGGVEIDGPYRPRPVPVDADAALREPARPTPGGGESKQGPFIAAIVLGLAVVFGGIAIGWSWLSGGSSSSDGPKIIMADKEPVKVLPENPGGTNVPNQDKAVYDKVDGNQSGSADQRNLNDSAEEPVDVVRKTIDPELLPLEGRDGEVSNKGEARLTADDTDSGVTDPGQSNPIISPRKVRTMVVRPDGTIVPREEPEEAVSVEPVAQPQPIVAATPTSTPTSTPATEVGAPVVREAPSTVEPIAEADPASVDGALTPVRTVKTVTIRKAPVPQSRPSEQPVNVVGQVSETGRVSGTPVEQVAAAQAELAVAAPAPVNEGGYYIQIASQPSNAAAKASYANLSNRYSSIIGGRGVDIQKANIPGRGVYHRVRIPAGSKGEAGNLCARYKSAGGSCLVTR